MITFIGEPIFDFFSDDTTFMVLMKNFLAITFLNRIGRTGRAGNVGYAVSFVNERNSNIIRELRDLLEENDQEVPNWLNQMCNYTARSSGSGPRRGGRGGGGHFGSRDVRYEKSDSKSHQTKGGSNYGGGYGSNFSNAAW